MWILDSEGDFLGGRRVWLRPGKKYLFGRIKQDGVRHAIQHASISRKHLVIEVSPVQPGDGSHIHTRSKLTLIDQNSKCGTTVDGEQIKGGSKSLSGDEHIIHLGRYQYPLRIKWQPVVLSFSFSSKELKAKDPLGPVRARLEDLDIKTVIPYVTGKTTHVVQNKRNTAKGLQALINAKYIVQDSYIDALVYAATPSDLENLESLSPLEEDFDAAWPDPALHLPPPGKEPVQRPAAAFAPNPERIRIFEGYTFVFCDASQFENLQAPINNGHGKALLYQVENGKTTAEEIVQFMRNAAGQKGLGCERDGPGGVVLVRFRAKGGYEEWSIELGNQVALMIDQRVIEQSEFLDAILGNDASPLCRPLPRETGPSVEENRSKSLEPDPVSKNIADPAPSQQEGVTTQKPAKRPRVRNFVSKVKNFDDGFDMESIPVYTLEAGDGSRDESQQVEMNDLPSEPAAAPAPPAEDDDDMSNLLPGANAMKRRRAEMGPRSYEDEPKTSQEEIRKPKRQKVDVLEAARRHREAEEAAARERRSEEESSLQAAIEGMTIEEMKRLVVVEELDVPLRDRRTPTAEETSRWDERWNGRKNFKKFRRKGDAPVPRPRVQTVIVPLEEVKRKDFGIGDHYWANNNRRDSPEPVSRHSSHQDLREASLAESRASVSQPSARSETPAPSSQRPSQRPIQKRAREIRDSDSEEELRFRFRRKR
ncbi:hypothetical protein VTN77DRAFT_9878 [Rasamsonia byssochlamydoides]|uniref:uncharacterized protein n=1 Tax=Rasamsonia byssochlamydoides TaxID=89139 RepID=UPI00374300D7